MTGRAMAGRAAGAELPAAAASALGRGAFFLSLGRKSRAMVDVGGDGCDAADEERRAAAASSVLLEKVGVPLGPLRRQNYLAAAVT